MKTKYVKFTTEVLLEVLGTIVTLILFCWVIYPYKWIRKLIYHIRKAHYCRRAADLSTRSAGKVVFVIQHLDKFYYGTRKSLRNNDKNITKRFFEGKPLECDYRNAIIAKYQYGKQCEDK